MASSRIRDLVSDLPVRLRENVEGYVDAVTAVLSDIEKDAGIQLKDRKEQYLILVAIRKIYSSVNSQYWIMNDCLEVAQRSEDLNGDERRKVIGFKIGRDNITRTSEAFVEGLNLKTDMDKLLSELEILPLIMSNTSLSELARDLVALTDGPR